MTFGHSIARALAPVIGEKRVDALRVSVYRSRHRIALTLDPTLRPTRKVAAAPVPPAPAPFAEFAEPTLTRHEFLAGLHAALQPRTYLEIGINDGRSLALSQARTIGVDPAFKITSELQNDLQLVRLTSDDFFALEDPLAHFEGTPVDLVFIDGMHLAEFSYHDFVNVERLVDASGVVVFDDMLPRNVDEAARNRHTGAWAGDVFKMIGILHECRPELVVLPINTAPTGMLVVTALDPASTVLADAYGELRARLKAADPQQVPDEVLHRRNAVGARSALDSTAWQRLVELRGTGADHATIAEAASGLTSIERLG